MGEPWTPGTIRTALKAATTGLIGPWTPNRTRFMAFLVVSLLTLLILWR